MPDHEYDIIVIGAGVCGAIAAWKLAKHGVSVLLLEAGETGPERLQLVGTYAQAPRKTAGSPYIGRGGDKYAPTQETMRDYYQKPHGSEVSFDSTYLRRVGGSTWHFMGNVPRLVPNDFLLRSTYGVGVDWPLTYKDLEEDYCEAENLMGVSGDHAQWDGLHGGYRSKPFPMSKVWESYSDRRVTEHIEGMSIDDAIINVISTPQARNSQPYDGRPACAGNSTCIPICPIQAKYDATVHVKKAVEAGVELRSQCVVTALNTTAGQTRVTEVRYRTWDSKEHTASARIIVLAAHSIETAKLLLLSNGGKGIANSSDQVGRNLMDHLQGAGAGLSREPLFPFRGPPTTSGIDCFRDGSFRTLMSAFRLSLGNDGWGRLERPVDTVWNLVFNEKLWGPALRDRIEDRVTRQFRMSYSTEMLPEPSNRVKLSSVAVDELGLPRPEIAFSFPDYNKKAFIYAQSVINAIFGQMGIPVEDRKFQDPNTFSGAGHIIGTTKMGHDPKQSVVDTDCRSHDHPNLFIFGSSVFPTCGTANPTLTAVALTLRGLRAVLADLQNQTC